MNEILRCFLFLLLPATLITGEFLLYRPLKKVANTYWFGLGIAVVYLAISMSCLGVNNGTKFAHFIPTKAENMSYQDSKLVSCAFFTNICGIIGLLLPIFLIVDPSRRLASAIAPIGIIASTTVVIFLIPFVPTINFDLNGLFGGHISEPDMHFFSHMTNLLLSIAIYLNSPRLGGKGAVAQYSILGCMYIYVGIIRCLFHPCYFVSGLSLQDYGPGGTYSFFNDVLHLPPIVSICLFFPLLLIAIFGLIMLMDALKNRKFFYYSSKFSGTGGKWYDYNAKEPNRLDGGWFSVKGQANHPRKYWNIEAKSINSK